MYRGLVTVPRRYVTDAIVLSRFDYGEADRILTLMTPSGGKVKAIAKGIRRQKSRIGGSLEPFAELRVALAMGRNFEIVTQVSVVHPWLNLRDNLVSFGTASYLAELADGTLEERHASESVYVLLKRAYEILDAGMAPGRVARWSGIGPRRKQPGQRRASSVDAHPVPDPGAHALAARGRGRKPRCLPRLC